MYSEIKAYIERLLLIRS